LLLIDILISGLILGGMYALVAMGLTLQYGVARILNLAYGEVLVGSAFAAYVLFTGFSISPLLGLAIVLPLAFVVNWLIYRVMLTPLVKRARTRTALEVDSILATFGLLFVLQGIAFVVFGGQYYSYSYLSVPITLLGSTVSVNRVIALCFAALLGTGLYLALTRTRWGTAIRAVAVNPAAAQLVGIDVRSVAAFAFALGGAMCAAGGVLTSMFLTFNAAMGVVFTMKALIVVIMGGVGNLLGALLAGLLLGLIETVVARLIDPGLTLAATFTLFLAVLLIRPTGLLGRPAS
jgi:branched-chain amino acid transport system permease protein